ncbi:MAG: hypothetical protein R3C28_13160 [Pirellulaceae bacterium]
MWKKDFEELLPHFREPASRGNLVPPGADDQQLRRTFKVFMANVQAALKFVPQRYDGSIQLIVAEDTIRSGKHQLTEEWQRLCSHVETHVCSGDHFSILQPPHVQSVATIMQQIHRHRQMPAHRIPSAA